MEFPNLGEHCSEGSCNRLDFLPLKCDACAVIFCTDHISYASHCCPSAYKKDVQVPVCPLCNAPVPTKRGDPPDLAVGLHIDNDCRSDFGKSRRKVFSNKCSSRGCKIKEVVQVKCTDCHKNYCLKHRHPTDHSCVGREESLRLSRLNALNKIDSQNNRGNSSNSFRTLQGTMSEDEALARALQASLQHQHQHQHQQQHQQQQQQQQQTVQSVPWTIRENCSLS